LTQLVALAVNAQVLAMHEAIVAGSELLTTNSTIGLAFDSASLVVTRVLIGGPAFETQQIFEGDTLVSIDGVLLKGQQGSSEKTSALIKGTDVPGSECKVQVKRKDSTQTQTVVLVRQADSLLGHKREMWDILSQAHAAFEKLGEHEKAKLIAAAKDLWIKTLLEQVPPLTL
jgi:hypothetical protein